MDRTPSRRHHGPTMETMQTTIAIGGVFVAAGAVKGITGMGLPTVAVSLLGLWMAPVQAAALLVAPSLATNVAQCRGPHARRLAAMLWPAWVALFVFTVLAPEPSGTDAPAIARRLLGVVLVAYGVFGLWRPVMANLSSRGPWLTAAAGAATGLVSAMSAVFVIPLVPFLQTLRLEKGELVQALGLSFTVATLALAVRVQATGGWLPMLSWEAAWALAAALGGMALGTQLRELLSGPAFQRSLFITFIALGLANLLKGA